MRIANRTLTRQEDDTVCLSFFDWDEKLVVEIPLFELQEIAEEKGNEAAQRAVIESLTAVLGELTPDEIRFALLP